MQLTLRPGETRLLQQILRGHLSNLKEEIYKTENYEWRQDLHLDEEIVKAMLARLDEELVILP